MGVNKVQLANGETLVDMSDATATSETVLAGYTAYGADGNLILGTAASTKRTEVNITLPVSGWVDNEQTVAVPAAVSVVPSLWAATRQVSRSTAPARCTATRTGRRTEV